jgi:hypothetical protein
MSIMKGYVGNRGHPKRSMIVGYTIKDVLECYNDYMKDGKPIGVPLSWHEWKISGKGTKNGKHSTTRIMKGLGKHNLVFCISYKLQ